MCIYNNHNSFIRVPNIVYQKKKLCNNKTITKQADAANGKCHYKKYTYMQQQNKKVLNTESSEEELTMSKFNSYM